MMPRPISTRVCNARMPKPRVRQRSATARIAVSVFAALAWITPAAATSVLSLGPQGVQSLIAEQLFNRAGRWYLIDDGGVCYTYLESPHARLEAARLVLRAHLVSRLGQPIGNHCAGADFASNVTVSGSLHGTEHKLLLDDIRI